MWQSIQQMERDGERGNETGKNQERSGGPESVSVCVCVWGGEGGVGGVRGGQVVLRAQQN